MVPLYQSTLTTLLMIVLFRSNKTTEFSEADLWAWWVTVKTEIREVSKGYEVILRTCRRKIVAARFRISPPPTPAESSWQKPERIEPALPYS